MDPTAVAVLAFSLVVLAISHILDFATRRRSASTFDYLQGYADGRREGFKDGCAICLGEVRVGDQSAAQETAEGAPRNALN